VTYGSLSFGDIDDAGLLSFVQLAGWGGTSTVEIHDLPMQHRIDRNTAVVAGFIFSKDAHAF